MLRIYEVKTECADCKSYNTYRVAASTFETAVAKVQKNIDKYQKQNYENYTERISEVRILASED